MHRSSQRNITRERIIAAQVMKLELRQARQRAAGQKSRKAPGEEAAERARRS